MPRPVPVLAVMYLVAAVLVVQRLGMPLAGLVVPESLLEPRYSWDVASLREAQSLSL